MSQELEAPPAVTTTETPAEVETEESPRLVTQTPPVPAGNRSRPPSSVTVRRRRPGRGLRVGLFVVGALLLLLPPAGAAYWSLRQPTTFAAEVDLLAQPNPTDTSGDMDRELATHQVLLVRPSMVDTVARLVGRDEQDLRSNVSVTTVDQSNVFRLQVVDRDQDRGRQAADLLARQYVAFNDGVAGGTAPALGHVQIVSAPFVENSPAGPKPLRAAAGGALVGLALLAAFVGLLRMRRHRKEPSSS